MPADFDDMQRRAMGILSDASQKVMGKVSLVYQTIKNAYETGDLVDYLTASSVFNALPGTKRNQIGHTAYEQARDAVGKPGTAVQAEAPSQLPKPVQLIPVIEQQRAAPVRPQQPPERPAPARIPDRIEPVIARPEPALSPTVVPLERPARPAAPVAPAPSEEQRPAAAKVVEIAPAADQTPAQPEEVAPLALPRAEPAAPRTPQKPSTEKVWGTGSASPNVAPLPTIGRGKQQGQTAATRPEPNRTPRPGGA
ncbi:MAG: hypothetical protein FJX55_18475 [Alphaproteobacteria bacterium]|nr:hypothetical protein [Alphaproteobacteria bacterium]